MRSRLKDPMSLDKELAAGTLVSHYRIVSKIGAGGMGEVYLAEDTRLDRRVAIKMLPPEMSGDEDRLRRFEQEAKATSALNHPNILTVYDFGDHEGSPFIVSEFLEGEELRDRLDRQPIPIRRVTNYAEQIVSGLSSAHERGVVHRDLKPENLFITNDERIKILDFGLAKLRERQPMIEGSEDATRKAMTDPGVVMGTVGYMSPEQVRGSAVDHRSDIFSLGLILYEMITGRRAFQFETRAETMTAILKEEPVEITDSVPNINPSLERIVRRCLEKKPERRFQSTSDLEFALQTLTGSTTSSGATASHAVSAESVEIASQPKSRKYLWMAAAAALLILACTAAWFGARRWLSPTSAVIADISYKPITFENGFVFAARFAPDGRTIVYSADWDRQTRGVYMTSLDSPEYRSLGFTGADLLAVSRSGDLAIMDQSRLAQNSYNRRGTLARVSLTGGSPRPELEQVSFADAGTGADMAAVLRQGDKKLLQYPIGQTIFERSSTSGSIANPRVSPSGEMVAAFDYDDAESAQSVKVWDRSGKLVTESKKFFDWWGLAWRSADEIWFAAADESGNRTNIYSLDLSGNVRTVYRAPGKVTLHDISAKGDVLVSFDRSSTYIELLEGNDPNPQDRSWREDSAISDIAADHTLLITGSGDSAGPKGSVYVWKPKAPQPVRISDGHGESLSPDASKALVSSLEGPIKVSIVPTGAGSPQSVNIGPLKPFIGGGWLSDGRLLIGGGVSGEPRPYLASATGGDPIPFLPDETLKLKFMAFSVDGRLFIAKDDSGKPKLCTVEPFSCGSVLALADGEAVLAWDPENKTIFTSVAQDGSSQIDRVDLASGRRMPWRTIRPHYGSPGGIRRIVAAPDGTIAYDYRRDANQLFVISGLK